MGITFTKLYYAIITETPKGISNSINISKD